MTTDRKYIFARGRNSGFRSKGQRSPALSGEPSEESSCNTKTPCVSVASAIAVSPAVSLPVSPASSREQTKTETQGSKWSNQSGSEPTSAKPNCYACKYRRDLAFDAHSECIHPRIGAGEAALSSILGALGMPSPAAKRLNISGASHGIQNGWFMWPVNYDPIWLNTCDGYEENA